MGGQAMQPRPVMIMAGGTGGHVYPALAVADYFQSKGVPLFWLGTSRGLEFRVVPEKGIELLTIKVSGVRGKGIYNLLLAPVKIFIAVLQATYICFRRRPAVVLGMGGFASGPGGIAAWLLRIPLLIHEQNRIAGTTNRILARFAVKVMQGFPNTFEPTDKVMTTGNPVRKEILDLAGPKTRRINRAANGLNVLVLGGSQGAKKLNHVVPLGLKRLKQKFRIDVRHQCGQKNFDDTEQRYKSLDFDTVKIEPFISDMAGAYGWADVVICRAGALTIAELCAAGLASILIPFPYAIDDHQTKNACYLSEQGAAILLPENELTEEKIATLLFELCTPKSNLLNMAERIGKLAHPAAAEAVGLLCLGEAHA